MQWQYWNGPSQRYHLWQALDYSHRNCAKAERIFCKVWTFTRNGLEFDIAIFFHLEWSSWMLSSIVCLLRILRMLNGDKYDSLPYKLASNIHFPTRPIITMHTNFIVCQYIYNTAQQVLDRPPSFGKFQIGVCKWIKSAGEWYCRLMILVIVFI